MRHFATEDPGGRAGPGTECERGPSGGSAVHVGPGQGGFLVPEASEEILTVVLSTVPDHERDGYAQRLEAFVEQHRGRLSTCIWWHPTWDIPGSPGSGPGIAALRRHARDEQQGTAPERAPVRGPAGPEPADHRNRRPALPP